MALTLLQVPVGPLSAEPVDLLERLVGVAADQGCKTVALAFHPADLRQHVLFSDAGAEQLVPVLRAVLARLESGRLRMPVTGGLRWVAEGEPAFGGAPGQARACRVCGCTDDNCADCVRRTGGPCYWVEADLCSACQPEEARDG